MTLDRAKEMVKKEAAEGTGLLSQAICKLLESHIDLKLSETAAKLKLLQENGYVFSSSYGIYANRHSKRIFSTEYIEKNTSDQLEKDIKDYKFFFLETPHSTHKHDMIVDTEDET